MQLYAKNDYYQIIQLFYSANNRSEISKKVFLKLNKQNTPCSRLLLYVNNKKEF
jgi:hypothetical protein